VVATQTGGEGTQARQVVGFDRGDPAVEPIALQVGHDLGERRHVGAGSVQVRAAGTDLLQPHLR
jgi:hypothetical protein